MPSDPASLALLGERLTVAGWAGGGLLLACVLALGLGCAPDG